MSGKLTVEANCKGKLPIWVIAEGGGAAAAGKAGTTVSADGFVDGGATYKIDGSTCVTIDCSGAKVAIDTCVNTIACYVFGNLLLRLRRWYSDDGSMKQRLFSSAAVAIGVIAGFFLYGIGRTMQETMSVTISGLLSGMFLGVCVPLVLAAPAVIGMRKRGANLRWLPLLVIMLIVGSVMAEVAILYDEHRFAREAEGARSIYSRSRAWPNSDAGLVFLPGKGIHATD